MKPCPDYTDLQVELDLANAALRNRIQSETLGRAINRPIDQLRYRHHLADIKHHHYIAEFRSMWDGCIKFPSASASNGAPTTQVLICSSKELSPLATGQTGTAVGVVRKRIERQSSQGWAEVVRVLLCTLATVGVLFYVYVVVLWATDQIQWLRAMGVGE